MRRRTLLAGLAATPLLAAAPRIATAAPGRRTTVALVPHQDDGVIRLSPYAAIAADRGDRMILLAATDGARTSVGPRLGLTPEHVSAWRHREQRQAWEWLTDGRGEVIPLGLPDGAATAADVLAGIRAVVDPAAPGVEVYVASYPPRHPGAVAADRHPDHVACIDAARTLDVEGTVVRYALHPTSRARGTTYRARTLHQRIRVAQAVACYQAVGRRSTRSLDLVVGGATRVTSWGAGR